MVGEKVQFSRFCIKLLNLLASRFEVASLHDIVNCVGLNSCLQVYSTPLFHCI